MISVPHDLEAEEVVLGAAMVSPERVVTIAQDLQAEDFYKPQHQALWRAFQALRDEGTLPDPVTLYDRATNYGYTGDPGMIVGLMSNAVSPQRRHVEIIIRHHAARELIRQCRETIEAIGTTEDPYGLADDLVRDLASLGSARLTDPEALTFEEWLERKDDEAGEWIIPDLITRDAMVLIVAAEGLGKATWMRMIGLCAAQGIQPMTRWKMKPLRVLYCDFENPLRNILFPASHLHKTLIEVTGNDYDSSRFKLWRRPAGINILNRRDRAAFEREIAAHRPDLVLIGPLARFYRRGNHAGYEDVADAVIDVVDHLREKYGFGVIIEHHAPKTRQELFPMGSQRWMGTPDIGITMKAQKTNPQAIDIDRFRGDRFPVRWPDHLERDNNWVFEAIFD